MTCATVDELAAAYALGALDADEERAVSDHLTTCAEPHAETRGLIGAAGMLPAATAPVEPSAALRARVMASVAATPQEHRPMQVVTPGIAGQHEEASPRVPWWRAFGSLAAAAAAVAVVVVIGLAAWNISLNQQLGQRTAIIRAIASADAVYQASGTAGSGLVLDSGDGAVFVADDLADLPAGSLYELWLIGPDGAPVAVGTLEDAGGVALVNLERALGPATTFAVTVETQRVDAPTTDPVLVATLEG